MTSTQWPHGGDPFLYANRTSIAAAAASVCATTVGYPLDSIKSRMQVKRYNGMIDCARQTYRGEGLGGFFRGIFVPLFTITLVRTSSFTIYNGVKEGLHSNGYFAAPTVRNKALSGVAGGASSGMLISVGSCAFELVKIRAQLESIIAAKQGRPFREMTTLQGAKEIIQQNGIRGLYAGFSLHALRDTLGTGIYFGMYDSLRFLAAQQMRDGSAGLYGVPSQLVPFICGSSCGVISWMILFPFDACKTRMQRDALAGLPRHSAWSIFRHLTKNGVRKLYSGLSVSAFRSFLSHGIMWTTLENVRQGIERYTGNENKRAIMDSEM